MTEGTELYREMLAFNYGDGERNEMMRNHWTGTPWMINIFTGSHPDGRDREMMEWCAERFGPEAWPYSTNPRAGRWKRGGATVFGWGWYGFDAEQAMKEFEAAFPNPPEEVQDRMRASAL